MSRHCTLLATLSSLLSAGFQGFESGRETLRAHGTSPIDAKVNRAGALNLLKMLDCFA